MMKFLPSGVVMLIPEYHDSRAQRTRRILGGALVLLILILPAWVVAKTVFGIRIPGVVVIAAIATVCLGTSLLLFLPVMWMTMLRQQRNKKGLG